MTVQALMEVLKRVDPELEVMLQLSEREQIYGAEMLHQAVRDPRWPGWLMLQGYTERPPTRSVAPYYGPAPEGAEGVKHA